MLNAGPRSELEEEDADGVLGLLRDGGHVRRGFNGRHPSSFHRHPYHVGGNKAVRSIRRPEFRQAVLNLFLQLAVSNCCTFDLLQDESIQHLERPAI